MSGHSKWASIKHKKAATDAKRGKIFTRLIREISLAARDGGGDPDKNARLRKAINDAKASNMPADNVKRAIMKGTGQLEGATYEEVAYEGYGPGGVAIFLQAVTDNKNRTVSEIRHIFQKNGGTLGEKNSVAWMFKRMGYIDVEKDKASEDILVDIALTAGADDLKDEDSLFQVTTSPENYEAVLEAVKKAEIEIAASEVGFLPQNYVKVEGKEAQQVLRLVNELEDHDDVQSVSSNFDISEEEIASFSQGE
ncbi:MAG TPA: YebC/PmpR family DNA-binding transcriptional regulator [Candidatus Aminicenantes bacterium]|nr:YebC/PmpR family DNA-binding transcriptional regulator [Candidatus Aminicenantes bacterium]